MFPAIVPFNLGFAPVSSHSENYQEKMPNSCSRPPPLSRHQKLLGLKAGSPINQLRFSISDHRLPLMESNRTSYPWMVLAR